MPSHILFITGLILMLGLMGGQVANRIKLPACNIFVYPV